MANKVTYILELRDRFTQASKKIKAASENMHYQLLRIGEAADKAKRKMSSFASSTVTKLKGLKNVGAGMTAAVTLPIVLMGNRMINAAMDAEESANKFNVVFRDVKEGALAMTAELNKSYGLTKVESQDLLASTGDLLTGFGFTQQSALGLSSQVQKLAVDLASFQNLQGGAKQASDALTKGLLGERESLKTLGIVIMEKDVKAKIASMKAAGKLLGMTERQAKAQATMQMALEQSKNALGDYARSTGSAKQVSVEMQKKFGDLSVEIGQKLLPLKVKLMQAAVKLMDWFSGLSDKSQTLIIAAVGLTAVLGPLLIVLGGIAMAVSVISLPLLAVGAAVGVVAAAFIYWDDILKAFSNTWNGIKEGVQDFKTSFMIGLGLEEAGPAGPQVGRRRSSSNSTALAGRAKGSTDTVQVMVGTQGGATAEVTKTASTGDKNMNVGVNNNWSMVSG